MLFSFVATAQSAYHGGKGDGYGMSELKAVFLSDGEMHAEPMRISVFPNPATSGETITITENIDSGIFGFFLFDMTGRTVAEIPVSNRGDHTFRLPGIVPGVYFLRAEGAQNIKVMRVEVCAF